MTWKGKTRIANALDVTDTELFSDIVTLAPNEFALVQADINFPGAPADDLMLNFYYTLDDVAGEEIFDNVAFKGETVDKGTDPSYRSYLIEKCYKFCVGFVATGAVDTIVVSAWVKIAKM